MKEAIGKVTIDALTPFMNALGKFVASDTFQDWVKKTGEFMQNDIKPIFVWFVDTAIPNLVEFGKKVGDVGSVVMTYLKPSFEGLWTVISDKVMPALRDLWHNIIEPLLPVFGVILVAALKVTIDTFSILLSIASDLIKFFADHRQIIIDFGIAFGVLAGYMAFNGIFNALTIGFNTLTLITIPNLMASMTTLKALIMSPTGMGGIAVAGALADIYLVKKAIDAVRGAIEEMNNAAASAKGAQDAANQTHATLLNLSKNGDSAQKARANALLAKGYASGGYTGAGAVDEVAGVVHKGEYVIPKSNVDQTTGTPKASGNTTINLNVNVGMYAGMPVEKREIALDMWKEIVRGARAQGVQLPMIGAVGVQ